VVFFLFTEDLQLPREYSTLAAQGSQ
jgi:hypothetical protein